MVFIKTGDDAKIIGVLCSCGGEIDITNQTCKKCGKKFEVNSNNNEKEKDNGNQN